MFFMSEARLPTECGEVEVRLEYEVMRGECAWATVVPSGSLPVSPEGGPVLRKMMPLTKIFQIDSSVLA